MQRVGPFITVEDSKVVSEVYSQQWEEAASFQMYSQKLKTKGGNSRTLKNNLLSLPAFFPLLPVFVSGNVAVLQETKMMP